MGAGDREVEGVQPGALGGAGGTGLLLADLLGAGLGLALGLRLSLGLGGLLAGLRGGLGLRLRDRVGLLLLGVGLRVDLVGEGGVEGDGPWVRPVSATLAASVSAARAGEASEPRTPVVARAAMPAAWALRRVRRLGARCFPVARVNAMEGLILSFLLAYRVS
ncbi:hypothetical protein M2436_005745 [Streptomyces sp. HB372]|nr:hypothetical protein [Streptomyces sp. HB372]